MRWLLFLVLPFFVVINAVCFWRACGLVVVDYGEYLWFALGVVVYVFVGRWYRNLGFLETFAHELAHAAVGLLLGHRIYGFSAGVGSGVVRHSSRNIFVSLAPYCLPLFTFVILLVRLCARDGVVWFFDVAAGVTAAFHFVAMWRDLSPRQPDIRDCGVVLSFLFIAAFLLLNTTLIVRAVDVGLLRAVWWYVMEVWEFVRVQGVSVLP